MKKTKRIVLLVLAVVVLLLAAYAGKTVLDLKNSAATEVQEEDSTRWAELTSDPLTLEGIADGSAKYASAAVNGSLNLVFNGIWSRQTDYFTVPGGSLTIDVYKRQQAQSSFLSMGVWTALSIHGSALARNSSGDRRRIYSALMARSLRGSKMAGDLEMPSGVQILTSSASEKISRCV